jgi:sugar phosphate isomerase/epimerase
MHKPALPGRVGVIQGRLSPKPADRLQAFPKAAWEREFDAASELGFDYIEWIYEADAATHNPLALADGRKRIREVAAATGVAVSSVCGDYFMVHKLSGEPKSELAKNVDMLKRVVGWAAEVGAERILLPLLETSAVPTAELKAEVVASLQAAADTAAEAGIVLGLEMEIPGTEYAALVARVGHPQVRVYYDTGNSTAQGLDIGMDVLSVIGALEAVHVKDRKTFGGSQPLGAGDANFHGFFAELAKHGFAGDFTLQHYFADDSRGAAEKSLAYVKERLATAGGEVA